MERIYLIPGTGVDRRLFSRLDLQGLEVKYLEWIDPLPHEQLEHYAARLARNIDTSRPFSLVGVSLGGMVAIEISKFLPVKKVVIISSIKNGSEKPWYFRTTRKVGLNHLFPYKLSKRFPALLKPFFGPMGREDTILFDILLRDSSIQFLDWSIKEILRWENTYVPPGLIHIHGTADRLFPVIFLKDYIPIKGAGHFLIVTRADEVSRMLKEIFADQPR